MKRHRWKFDPTREEPFEISRSGIESFIKCPACFWMKIVKGIKFPGMPGFLLNSATDTLLKKDFDRYRNLGKPHPFMERNGLGHLVPYKHDDFETWTKSLQLGLRTNFEEQNLIVGGGLDDVWHNPKTNEIHIVDYKSTAQGKNEEGNALKEINLYGAYKEGYKRQMDIYSWIMRRNGFNVSKDCYFVYVNGDQYFEEGMLLDDYDKAKMMFDVHLIKYVSDDSWVSKTLADLKSCLVQESCPDHSLTGYGPKGDKPCENFMLFEGMKENNLI